ncbi:DNA-binding protein [Paraclostridium sordellii 8483]|uniref:helix-turn-helix domain-containing protein n=1 Tax=Paraclostridium sordellii TaxID=1505 RepID=UPI00030FF06C|nr:helix-turn-helix domain-containing protein [Paeniclostridium sordellii]TAN66811.1 DNA-binding protein [Paeniclostridium sordellii 8483]
MEIYSVSEAAKKMKTSNQKIYELIDRKLLEALRLNSLRVPEYAIEDFFRKYKFKDLSDLDNIKELK